MEESKPGNGATDGTEIVAVITISMDAKGNITFNGPVQNRFLCYGMLEFAKDLIRSYPSQNKIITPTGIRQNLKHFLTRKH